MTEILITSSVLILVLLALRKAFQNSLSRRVQYALWALVLLRLLVPVSLPAVDFSVLTAAQTVEQTVTRNIDARPVYVPVARALWPTTQPPPTWPQSGRRSPRGNRCGWPGRMIPPFSTSGCLPGWCCCMFGWREGPSRGCIC